MALEPRRGVPDQLAELVGQQVRGLVSEQLRQKVSDWRSPRAKLLRRRRRAVRATATWGTIGGVTGAGATVLEVAGGQATFAVVGLFTVAGVTGLATVRAAIRSYRLHKTPLPEVPPAPVLLPPAGSLAREPMQRLAEAEDALGELLRQLESPAMTSVPADSVTQARATGAEAAGALRAVAGQLQAVERARDTAPPLQRGPLVDGVRRLRAQLDEGVDGYGGLVAAAGRAVVESRVSDPKRLLTDATDHLAGLASALRDLSPRGGVAPDTAN
ncbi:hypothetical protein F0L68_22555 [Solihabitans fulvus]|uniref:Uncharacterized protein n=1 Tax=Solihabitans fulvus TaxID=1892852 RepID=A0A5B2X5H8_9PSEU|nr:hypothetical protein [Solihabitans fulvus]KAA2258628.1 hypothetical protein F0L68_22555 [Solihabitans fulvus]